MSMMIMCSNGHPARSGFISSGWKPLIDHARGNKDTGFLIMPSRRKNWLWSGLQRTTAAIRSLCQCRKITRHCCIAANVGVNAAFLLS